MNRARALVLLVLGALVGGVVSPWWAVQAGLAPWWAPVAFLFAVGPVRWVRWVVAGAYEESHWSTTAVGDDGTSLGILQYRKVIGTNRTAPIRPVDRTSPWEAGLFAAGLTVAGIGDDWRPYVVLRVPVFGYLLQRSIWRAGRVVALIPRPPETTQAWEGFGVNAALAVAAWALFGIPIAAIPGLPAARRWWRRG